MSRSFPKTSGTSVQSIIDANKPQVVAEALGDLFGLWSGTPKEAISFGFIPGHNTIRILLPSDAPIDLGRKAQDFLLKASGYASDAKTPIESDGLFHFHEPLQRWAIGIQAMRRGLSQQAQGPTV